MMGQMAIAIALPGFNDLGHLVTPIFLLTDHFLCRFSTLSKKSLNFLQNASSNSVALCVSVWRFQMPLGGLSFVKTLKTFGIINATDSLIQNITSLRIVCLRSFIFDILS